MAKPEIQYRELSIVRDAIDMEKRMIRLSFSSDVPYLRKEENTDFVAWEVLSHEEGAMDSSRLSRGLVPVLVDHDKTKQVGVITDYQISDGKAYALAKISRSDEGTSLLNDVFDGIRTGVSVGYKVNKREKSAERDGYPVTTATKWTPYEVSFVSVPADASVGVGRSEEESAPEVVEKVSVIIPEQKNFMADNANTETKVEVREGPDVNKIRTDEHSRVREIMAIATRFNAGTEANDFIRDGKSVTEFQAFVLNNKVGSKSTESRVFDPTMGMNFKDRSNYSFTKAIMEVADRSLGTGAGLSGLELEASQEVARRTGRPAKGFYIPDFALLQRDSSYSTRDLSVTGSAAAGGDLVATILEPTLIPFLRNLTVVGKCGATMMGGLVGNVAIPRQVSAAQATWTGETTNASRTAAAFDQISMTPNRLYGETAYSKLLLAQSSIDVQSVVRQDLLEVVALAIDLAALTGSGSGNIPGGITSLVADTTYPSAYAKSSPSVVFGSGYPTFTKVVSFEEALELNNVNLDDASISWVVDPTVKAMWKTVGKSDPRATAFYPEFLWTGTNPGIVNGYKAFSTNQLSGGKVIFGKFRDLIIATWGGGLDIEVDPFTLMSSAQIRIGINTFADIGFRYGPSFVYSTDSGAQHT